MPETSEWAPTVDDVGALLRSRTKDTNGVEVGTFTPNTRPTQAQVEQILRTAVGDLADMIATDVPERLWPSARRVATYSAALDIELGYFPEQLNTGRSPYVQLKERYDELIKSFRASLEAAGSDPGDDGATTPGAPSYSFPMDVPIIGWRNGAW